MTGPLAALSTSARALLVTLAVGTCLSAAPDKRTFTGTITDDMCATKEGHKRMQMGPTDADCTRECVLSHGAEYVLYNGAQIYNLSDQKRPATFAGQRVRVVGVLDDRTKTIAVESIDLVK